MNLKPSGNSTGWLSDFFYHEVHQEIAYGLGWWS